MFLIGHQFYSSYLVEGLEQADIDKVNSRLSDLVSKVDQLNSSSGLKGDVLILRSDVDKMKGYVDRFASIEPQLNEMIKASNDFVPCPST